MEHHQRRGFEAHLMASHDHAYGRAPAAAADTPFRESFAPSPPAQFGPALPHSNSKGHIVHVIEEAESVIRDQAFALADKEQTIESLLSVLKVKERELQNARMEQAVGARAVKHRSSEDNQNSQQPGPSSTQDKHGQLQGVEHQTSSRDMWPGNTLPVDSQSTIVVHPHVRLHSESSIGHPLNGLQGQPYTSTRGASTTSKPFTPIEGAAFSRISSPSSSSMYPIRYHRETEAETQINVGGQGFTHYLGEVPSSNVLWPQQLLRAQEKITRLQKLLSDAELKEMQMTCERRMLGERLLDLQLKVDQYQQGLLDAMSTNQVMFQESVRLSSELEAVKKDADFYASSLSSLLMEFNLQPAATDALSIVRSIKVLVEHLYERNNTYEGKPKESPRSHEPGQTNHVYQSLQHFTPPSRNHRPLHDAHNRDVVSHPEIPISPTSPHNRVNEWELQGVPGQHANGSDYYEYVSDRVRPSPYNKQVLDESQNGFPLQGAPSADRGINHDETVDRFTNGETGSNTGQLSQSTQKRGARESPQLPTLNEEPNSPAFADEDLLPAIEGLCINGKAVLGNEIGASGVSINGTSLCHFQWVRHYADGTFKYIPGAAQPSYTITVDDIDTRIELECTPMDEHDRRGEMIKVFANDHNLITLEASMQDQINDYVIAGQAVFDVKFMEGSSDSELESGILTLKRSHYKLKRSSTKKDVISERYTAKAMEVKILDAVHAEYMVIETDNRNSCILALQDVWVRDLVVLTMREFIRVAFERQKEKKKLWISK